LAGLQVPENTPQPGHEANESGTTCVTVMGAPTIQHKRPVGREGGRKEEKGNKANEEDRRTCSGMSSVVDVITAK